MKKFFKKYIIGKVNTLKENITLLAENDKEVFNANAYLNQGGNCAACVVCDILNEYYEENKYTPKARTKQNNLEYTNMCDTLYALYFNSNYDYDFNNLKECVESDFSGLIIIACRGGYHAIRIKDHLILNNWENREYQTLKQFLKEIQYKKTPINKYFVSDNDIINFENKLINRKIIKTII